MNRIERIAFAAALAAVFLGPAHVRGASTSPDNTAMRRLAADRGCVVCHSDTAPGGEPAVSAYGPSWDEIADRYAGRADAEEARLARLVLTGSDPQARHWKGRASFAQMLPNEGEVSAEEARLLVRWILSGRR
ncbi:MAG TPA: c-type cytochrome [Usitatibacter sp.]|nr:c-type cytochrome [Usitatibacter sp.]